MESWTEWVPLREKFQSQTGDWEDHPHLLCEVTVPTVPLDLGKLPHGTFQGTLGGSSSSSHFLLTDSQRSPPPIPRPREGHRCPGPQGAPRTRVTHPKMWPTSPGRSGPGGENGSPPSAQPLRNTAPQPFLGSQLALAAAPTDAAPEVRETTVAFSQGAEERSSIEPVFIEHLLCASTGQSAGTVVLHQMAVLPAPVELT